MKYHFCIYTRNYYEKKDDTYVCNFIKSYINNQLKMNFPYISFVSSSNDRNDFYVMSQMKAMCTYYSFMFEVTEEEHTANIIQGNNNIFARKLAESIAHFYKQYQALSVMTGNIDHSSLLLTDATLDIRFDNNNVCNTLLTGTGEWSTYDSTPFSPFSYHERRHSWLNGLPVGKVSEKDHCIFIMRIYW
jgi:hypothetical protein